MGRRINTVMQTCFFALSGVLPRERGDRRRSSKRSRKPTASAARRSSQKNYAAVDAALDTSAECRRAAIDDSVTPAARDRRARSTGIRAATSPRACWPTKAISCR